MQKKIQKTLPKREENLKTVQNWIHEMDTIF